MNRAYLVIDVGSGSIRVILFGQDCGILDAEVCRRPVRETIDTDACWQTIVELTRRLTRRSPSLEVAGIGATSLLAWTAVDQAGQPVEPTRTWMDVHPELLEEFRRSFDQDVFFQRTGRCAGAELSGLKQVRLMRVRPERYQAVSAFFSLKDFINFRLTGEAATDRTTACYTMLYNIHTDTWDAEITDALSLDVEKLPRILGGNQRVGTLLPAPARLLGLTPGIPVAAGGPDGSVGVLGAGVRSPGEAVSVMGTTDVLFALSDRLLPDPGRRIVANPFLLPGLWLLGGPMGMSGGALDWFARSLDGGRHTMAELDQAAALISPGCDGVVAVSGLTGERTPFWNDRIRGTMAGVTPETTPAHLYRAFLEANCYTIRQILDILAETGQSVRHITAIGGGAGSSVWMQMKADVTGLPVLLPGQTEATALGAAVLASMAAEDGGVFDNPETRRYLPQKQAAYETAYGRYLRLQRLCDSYYTGD